MKKIITENLLEEYRTYLYQEEKSKATINKYISDIRKLMKYADGNEISKELMIQYKEYLREEKQYKSASVNSYLVAANGFFEYMKWYGFRVKTIKIQRDVFIPEEKELTREDFRKLVLTAKALGRKKIAMVLETICATGMRVSEVQFVTVEAVQEGVVRIYNKGKERKVLIQRSLKKDLLLYIRKYKIETGRIFCTSSGKALDRSYIWREMKKLCKDAGVAESKAFPHNLRALFAKCFYAMYKDIVKLADILGHSNMETTRIYIKSSGAEHQKQLDDMNLLEGL